jgi:RNA polymerase sigma-70 factor (ECF subfamily)
MPTSQPPVDGDLTSAISAAIVELYQEFYGHDRATATTYINDNIVVCVLEDILTTGESALVSPRRQTRGDRRRRRVPGRRRGRVHRRNRTPHRKARGRVFEREPDPSRNRQRAVLPRTTAGGGRRRQLTHGPAAATALSDEALMQRVQADDDRAFELLYDRNQNRAWLLARALCRQGDRIERILHDAFTAAWRERAGYRPDHEAFNAWTMRAIPAERRCSQVLARTAPDRTARRRRQSRARTTNSSGPNFSGSPRAPPVDRAASFGGLTHDEIARRLQLPLGTAKGRLRLALEKLRRATADE